MSIGERKSFLAERRLARARAIWIIKNAKLKEKKILDEAIEKSTVLTEANAFDKAAVLYLLYRINQPLTSWKAFQIGLIDDKGNIIRQPTTSYEKDALGSLDRFVLMLKKYIPSWAMTAFSVYSAYKIIFDSVDTDNSKKLLEELEKKIDLES